MTDNFEFHRHEGDLFLNFYCDKTGSLIAARIDSISVQKKDTDDNNIKVEYDLSQDVLDKYSESEINDFGLQITKICWDSYINALKKAK